jgi:hypothetical protein
MDADGVNTDIGDIKDHGNGGDGVLTTTHYGHGLGHGEALVNNTQEIDATLNSTITHVTKINTTIAFMPSYKRKSLLTTNIKYS